MLRGIRIVYDPKHDLHRLDFGLLAAQHYAFADRPVENFLDRADPAVRLRFRIVCDVVQHADQPIRPFVFAAHGLTSFR